MDDSSGSAAFWRDWATVLSAIVIATCLAWIYVLWLATGTDAGMSAPAASPMGSMAPGMGARGAMLGPSLRPWGVTDFAFMFVMWAVMMVGMMLPSVTPMVLLYASAGRKAAERGQPLAATGWFVAGYLLVWIAFSFAATLAQWQLSRFALITPMLSSASDLFGGAMLLAAGLYQWSPLKDACLGQCQSPLGFLISRGGFKARASGSLRLGVEHGALCVGCCWVLMALLFVGGVMNPLWIVSLTILILLEKIAPTGRFVPRLAGAAMVAAGLFFLYRAVFP